MEKGIYGVGDAPGHKNAQHWRGFGMHSPPHEPRHGQSGHLLELLLMGFGLFVYNKNMYFRERLRYDYRCARLSGPGLAVAAD
jgi:hypothetical protein